MSRRHAPAITVRAAPKLTSKFGPAPKKLAANIRESLRAFGFDFSVQRFDRGRAAYGRQ